MWARVSWDGRIDDAKGDTVVGTGEAQPTSSLLSLGAWKALELELGRDSELRLLIVVVRVSSMVMPGMLTGLLSAQ